LLENGIPEGGKLDELKVMSSLDKVRGSDYWSHSVMTLIHLS